LGRGVEEGSEGGVVWGVKTSGEGDGNLGVEAFVKVILKGI
jgi:hypothetical protein